MAAVAEARVLQPDSGIQIDGEPAEPGAILFDNSLDFTTRDGPNLKIKVQYGGNGLRSKSSEPRIVMRIPTLVSCAEEPVPAMEMRDVKVKWGHDPSLGTTRAFGMPHPVVEVEYLGHPQRDIHEPLMEAQSNEYDETRVAPYTNGRGFVVFGGRPFHSAKIYGLEYSMEEYGFRDKVATYPGHVMLGAAIEKPARQGPRIKLFATTKADGDNIIRTRVTSPFGIYDVKNVEEVLQGLAAISVLTREATDSKAFPLFVINAMGSYLRRRNFREPDLDPYTTDIRRLQEAHGIDLPAMIRKLPRADVLTEKERLHTIFNSFQPRQSNPLKRNA